MSELPTGTITTLFTDVEGSTRLLQELGTESYRDALERHRRVLRAVFARHNGVEVELEGDSFHVAFARATDAVAAAAEAQAALAAHGGPLRVRIGIHTGQPVVSDGLYVGIDIHRAARFMSAGHGGQVLISQTTRDLIGDEFALRPLGEHRLKDLLEPEPLYQLLIDGLPNDFPALTTLEIRRTNLPVRTAPLIGRQRDVEDVCALLIDGTRLLTLTGPGGVGKTRLALQAAAELVDRFRDGAFLVDLAAVDDPSLVVRTIAQTLALRESGSETLEATLERHLRDKRLLVVLDNFEQVLDAAPSVARLLEHAPELRFLVTSRAPLRVAAERERAIAPLAHEEGIQLFRARAPVAAKDARTEEAIAAICRRLDGLPLAIELAAARTRLLPPVALLARLEERLGLLSRGQRDAPPRHQTLRAAIEWSYDLLAPTEQRLFARLSVFVGGRTLEAADEICNPGSELGIDTVDGFATLVENSLLVRPNEMDDGRPRFRMLETIHEYARERLEQSGEADEIGTRHARYYLRLAEAAEPELKGAHQREWIALLEAEHENFRTAFSSFALSSEETLRLAAALSFFWYMRGHLREGRDRLERALSADAAPELRVAAIDGAVLLALAQGDAAALERFAADELAIARDLGDSYWVGRALTNLGTGAQFAGDMERANRLLLASVDELREHGDNWALGISLINLGSGFVDDPSPAGGLENARALFSEALELFREIGNEGGMAWAISNLGHALLEERRFDEAIPVLQEALALTRALDDPEWTINCLEGLAEAAVARGEFERAALLLGASAAACDATGVRLQPGEAQVRERSLAALREYIGDEQLVDALRRGGELGLDGAAELAKAATAVNRRS